MDSFFETIKPLEIFDNLLVVAMLYAITRILKKEASLRIFITLATLIIAKHTANLIGLTSTYSFINLLLSSSPVIIAVIFQSDLKRTLFSLWKKNQSTVSNSSEITSTVDELMNGLEKLAERRIGALIVIVRQMSIDHLIQIGTEIDAKVTSELLNSIFLPYSPIHDGAVIIQKEKIISAGCILPLSQNPDIAKSFGTRHRAALGISEQTDVLVLVVSEETGKISIVHDGKINYDADPAEIKRLLRKGSVKK